MKTRPVIFAYAVARCRDVAVRLGIPRREQEEMAGCFSRS